MKTKLLTLAAIAMLSLPLAACDPFTASASCHTRPDGVVECSGAMTPGASATPAPPVTTTNPPATTTPPATTNPPVSSSTSKPPVTITVPPTSTSNPPTVSTEAAVRLGWGAPLPQSDEFSGAGLPDPAKWGVYGLGGSGNCWEGHAGNGRRCAARNVVGGGFLRQSGLANGDSAGIASNLNQRYGKWELRARVAPVAGATGKAYHPVLLTWPLSEKFPQGGELDFMETNVNATRVDAFVHHPADTVIQDQFTSGQLDLTQWHNFALSWTPQEISGYIDGVKWFSDTKPAAQPPGPMHLAIQLDNYFGSGMQAANLDVDFARIYS